MNSQYYSSLLIVFVSITIIAFSIFFIYTYYKKRQIERYSNLKFPKEYEDILQNIPLYKKLNSEDREKITHSILIFINTKKFIGVSLELNDEIKIVIAFHACLLLLHLENFNCYDNLSTILIYPNTVIAHQISSNGGIYTKGDFLLEGQSSSDTVVLSWNDAKKDAYHLNQNNVIIHEFAHEIDFLDGVADGTPPLPYSKYHEWAKVLSYDFNKLQSIAIKNRDWGKYKIIGEYAATNEAEFFAVVSERYFENPEQLKKNFHELYNELEDFYNIYDSKIQSKDIK